MPKLVRRVVVLLLLPALLVDPAVAAGFSGISQAHPTLNKPTNPAFLSQAVIYEPAMSEGRVMYSLGQAGSSKGFRTAILGLSLTAATVIGLWLGWHHPVATPVLGTVFASLHEYAHARVQALLAPTTPEMKKRVSVDPRRHLWIFNRHKPFSPFLSVEYDPKHPHIRSFLAGPVVNLVLAAVLFVIGNGLGGLGQYPVLNLAFQINAGLGLVNLFGLDGIRAFHLALERRSGQSNISPLKFPRALSWGFLSMTPAPAEIPESLIRSFQEYGNARFSLFKAVAQADPSGFAAARDDMLRQARQITSAVARDRLDLAETLERLEKESKIGPTVLSREARLPVPNAMEIQVMAETQPLDDATRKTAEAKIEQLIRSFPPAQQANVRRFQEEVTLLPMSGSALLGAGFWIDNLKHLRDNPQDHAMRAMAIHEFVDTFAMLGESEFPDHFFIEGRKPLIFLSRRADTAITGTVVLHEAIHAMAKLGFLGIPYHSELITEAATSIDIAAVRGTSSQDFAVTGKPGGEILFAAGQEWAQKTDRPTQESAEAWYGRLKDETYLAVTNHWEAFGYDSLQQAEKSLKNYETLERQMGLFLGGAAWQWAGGLAAASEDNPVPPLRELIGFADSVFSHLTKDQTIEAIRNPQREARLVEKLKQELKSRFGEPMPQIRPWKKGSPVDQEGWRWRPASGRSMAESVLEYPQTAFWHPDEEMTLFRALVQTGVAIANADVRLSPDLSRQPAFIGLWNSIETARAEEAIVTEWPGRAQDRERLYVLAYPNPDSQAAANRMAALPLSFQFIEGVLFEARLGRQDPRVGTPDVRRALEETQSIRAGLLNPDTLKTIAAEAKEYYQSTQGLSSPSDIQIQTYVSQKLVETIEKDLWPVLKPLYERDLSDANTRARMEEAAQQDFASQLQEALQAAIEEHQAAGLQSQLENIRNLLEQMRQDLGQVRQNAQSISSGASGVAGDAAQGQPINGGAGMTSGRLLDQAQQLEQSVGKVGTDMNAMQAASRGARQEAQGLPAPHVQSETDGLFEQGQALDPRMEALRQVASHLAQAVRALAEQIGAGKTEQDPAGLRAKTGTVIRTGQEVQDKTEDLSQATQSIGKALDQLEASLGALERSLKGEAAPSGHPEGEAAESEGAPSTESRVPEGIADIFTELANEAEREPAPQAPRNLRKLEEDTERSARMGFTAEQWRWWIGFLKPLQPVIETLASEFASKAEGVALTRTMTGLDQGPEVIDKEIYRILTDGRIFGDKLLPGKVRLIMEMLLDASSSMGDFDDHSSKFYQALQTYAAVSVAFIRAQQKLPPELEIELRFEIWAYAVEANIPLHPFGTAPTEKSIYDAVQKAIAIQKRGDTQDAATFDAATRSLIREGEGVRAAGLGLINVTDGGNEGSALSQIQETYALPGAEEIQYFSKGVGEGAERVPDVYRAKGRPNVRAHWSPNVASMQKDLFKQMGELFERMIETAKMHDVVWPFLMGGSLVALLAHTGIMTYLPIVMAWVPALAALATGLWLNHRASRMRGWPRYVTWSLAMLAAGAVMMLAPGHPAGFVMAGAMVIKPAAPKAPYRWETDANGKEYFVLTDAYSFDHKIPVRSDSAKWTAEHDGVEYTLHRHGIRLKYIATQTTLEGTLKSGGGWTWYEQNSAGEIRGVGEHLPDWAHIDLSVAGHVALKDKEGRIVFEGKQEDKFWSWAPQDIPGFEAKKTLGDNVPMVRGVIDASGAVVPDALELEMYGKKEIVTLDEEMIRKLIEIIDATTRPMEALTNAALTGHKSTGKNTALYLLAGLVEQPIKTISFHQSISDVDLRERTVMGLTRPLTTEKLPGEFYQAGELGYWLVADEVTKAERESVLTTLNTVLQSRRDAKYVFDHHARFFFLWNPAGGIYSGRLLQKVADFRDRLSGILFGYPDQRKLYRRLWNEIFGQHKFKSSDERRTYMGLVQGLTKVADALNAYADTEEGRGSRVPPLDYRQLRRMLIHLRVFPEQIPYLRDIFELDYPIELMPESAQDDLKAQIDGWFAAAGLNKPKLSKRFITENPDDPQQDPIEDPEPIIVDPGRPYVDREKKEVWFGNEELGRFSLPLGTLPEDQMEVKSFTDTPENNLNLYLLAMDIHLGFHFAALGESGTAKTNMIKYLFQTVLRQELIIPKQLDGETHSDVIVGPHHTLDGRSIFPSTELHLAMKGSKPIFYDEATKASSEVLAAFNNPLEKGFLTATSGEVISMSKPQPGQLPCLIIMAGNTGTNGYSVYAFSAELSSRLRIHFIKPLRKKGLKKVIGDIEKNMEEKVLASGGTWNKLEEKDISDLAETALRLREAHREKALPNPPSLRPIEHLIAGLGTQPGYTALTIEERLERALTNENPVYIPVIQQAGIPLRHLRIRKAAKIFGQRQQMTESFSESLASALRNILYDYEEQLFSNDDISGLIHDIREARTGPKVTLKNKEDLVPLFEKRFPSVGREAIVSAIDDSDLFKNLPPMPGELAQTLRQALEKLTSGKALITQVRVAAAALLKEIGATAAHVPPQTGTKKQGALDFRHAILEVVTTTKGPLKTGFEIPGHPGERWIDPQAYPVGHNQLLVLDGTKHNNFYLLTRSSEESLWGDTKAALPLEWLNDQFKEDEVKGITVAPGGGTIFIHHTRAVPPASPGGKGRIVEDIARAQYDSDWKGRSFSTLMSTQDGSRWTGPVRSSMDTTKFLYIFYPAKGAEPYLLSFQDSRGLTPIFLEKVKIQGTPNAVFDLSKSDWLQWSADEKTIILPARDGDHPLLVALTESAPGVWDQARVLCDLANYSMQDDNFWLESMRVTLDESGALWINTTDPISPVYILKPRPSSQATAWAKVDWDAKPTVEPVKVLVDSLLYDLKNGAPIPGLPGKTFDIRGPLEIHPTGKIAILLVHIDGRNQLLSFNRDSETGVLASGLVVDLNLAATEELEDTPRFSPEGTRILALVKGGTARLLQGEFSADNRDVSDMRMALVGTRSEKWPEGARTPSWGASNAEILLNVENDDIAHTYSLVLLRSVVDNPLGPFDTNNPEILLSHQDVVEGLAATDKLFNVEPPIMLPDGRILGRTQVNSPQKDQAFIVLSRNPADGKVIKADHQITMASIHSSPGIWHAGARLWNRPGTITTLREGKEKKIVVLRWPIGKTSSAGAPPLSGFRVPKGSAHVVRTTAGPLATGELIPDQTTALKWERPLARPLPNKTHLLVLNRSTDENSFYLLAGRDLVHPWTSPVRISWIHELVGEELGTSVHIDDFSLAPDGRSLVASVYDIIDELTYRVQIFAPNGWLGGGTCRVLLSENQPDAGEHQHFQPLEGSFLLNEGRHMAAVRWRSDGVSSELGIFPRNTSTGALQEPTALIRAGAYLPGWDKVSLTNPSPLLVSSDGHEILVRAQRTASTGAKPEICLATLHVNNDGTWGVSEVLVGLDDAVMGDAASDPDLKWKAILSSVFEDTEGNWWMNIDGQMVVLKQATSSVKPPVTTKPFDLAQAKGEDVETTKGVIAGGQDIPGIPGEKWENPKAFPLSGGRELLVVDGRKFFLLKPSSLTGKWIDTQRLSWIEEFLGSQGAETITNIVTTPDGNQIILDVQSPTRVDAHGIFTLHKSLAGAGWTEKGATDIGSAANTQGAWQLTPAAKWISMSPNRDGSKILVYTEQPSGEFWLFMLNVHDGIREYIKAHGDLIGKDGRLKIDLAAFPPQLSPDGRSILMAASADAINPNSLLMRIALEAGNSSLAENVPDAVLNTKIIDLVQVGISVRKPLINANIVTVGELLQKTDIELMTVTGLGRKGINKLKRALRELLTAAQAATPSVSKPPSLILLSQDANGHLTQVDVQGELKDISKDESFQFGPTDRELWINSHESWRPARMMKWPGDSDVTGHITSPPAVPLSEITQSAAIEAIDTLLDTPIGSLPDGLDFAKRLTELAAKVVAEVPAETPPAPPASPVLPSIAFDQSAGTVERIQTTAGPLEHGAQIPGVGKKWTHPTVMALPDKGGLIVLDRETEEGRFYLLRPDQDNKWGPAIELSWIRHSAAKVLKLGSQRELLDFHNVSLSSDGQWITVVAEDKMSKERRFLNIKLNPSTKKWTSVGKVETLDLSVAVDANAPFLKTVRIETHDKAQIADQGRKVLIQLGKDLYLLERNPVTSESLGVKWLLREGNSVPGQSSLEFGWNSSGLPAPIISADGKEIIATAFRWDAARTFMVYSCFVLIKLNAAGEWQESLLLHDRPGPIGSNGVQENLHWEFVTAITHIDNQGDWWLRMRTGNKGAAVVLHRSKPPAPPAPPAVPTPAIADSRAMDWMKASLAKVQTDKGPIEKDAPISKRIFWNEKWGQPTGRPTMHPKGELLHLKVEGKNPNKIVVLWRNPRGIWSRIHDLFSRMNVNLTLNGKEYSLKQVGDPAITADGSGLLIPCQLENIATGEENFQILRFPAGVVPAPLGMAKSLLPDQLPALAAAGWHLPEAKYGLGVFDNEYLVWAKSETSDHKYGLFALVLDALGHMQHVVLRHEVDDASLWGVSSPTVSPDGRQLIFGSQHKGRWTGNMFMEIEVLDRDPKTGDLSNMRRMHLPTVDMGQALATPDFSPDGYTLYVTAEKGVFELNASVAATALPPVPPAPAVVASGKGDWTKTHRENAETTEGALASLERINSTGEFEWDTPSAQPTPDGQHLIALSDELLWLMNKDAEGKWTNAKSLNLLDLLYDMNREILQFHLTPGGRMILLTTAIKGNSKPSVMEVVPGSTGWGGVARDVQMNTILVNGRSFLGSRWNISHVPQSFDDEKQWLVIQDAIPEVPHKHAVIIGRSAPEGRFTTRTDPILVDGSKVDDNEKLTVEFEILPPQMSADGKWILVGAKEETDHPVTLYVPCLIQIKLDDHHRQESSKVVERGFHTQYPALAHLNAQGNELWLTDHPAKPAVVILRAGEGAHEPLQEGDKEHVSAPAGAKPGAENIRKMAASVLEMAVQMGLLMLPEVLVARLQALITGQSPQVTPPPPPSSGIFPLDWKTAEKKDVVTTHGPLRQYVEFVPSAGSFVPANNFVGPLRAVGQGNHLLSVDAPAAHSKLLLLSEESPKGPLSVHDLMVSLGPLVASEGTLKTLVWYDLSSDGKELMIIGDVEDKTGVTKTKLIVYDFNLEAFKRDEGAYVSSPFLYDIEDGIPGLYRRVMARREEFARAGDDILIFVNAELKGQKERASVFSMKLDPTTKKPMRMERLLNLPVEYQSTDGIEVSPDGRHVLLRSGDVYLVSERDVDTGDIGEPKVVQGLPPAGGFSFTEDLNRLFMWQAAGGVTLLELPVTPPPGPFPLDWSAAVAKPVQTVSGDLMKEANLIPSGQTYKTIHEYLGALKMAGQGRHLISVNEAGQPSTPNLLLLDAMPDRIFNSPKKIFTAGPLPLDPQHRELQSVDWYDLSADGHSLMVIGNVAGTKNLVVYELDPLSGELSSPPVLHPIGDQILGWTRLINDPAMAHLHWARVGNDLFMVGLGLDAADGNREKWGIFRIPLDPVTFLRPLQIKPLIFFGGISGEFTGLEASPDGRYVLLKGHHASEDYYGIAEWDAKSEKLGKSKKVLGLPQASGFSFSDNMNSLYMWNAVGGVSRLELPSKPAQKPSTARAWQAIASDFPILRESLVAQALFTAVRESGDWLIPFGLLAALPLSIGIHGWFAFLSVATAGSVLAPTLRKNFINTHEGQIDSDGRRVATHLTVLYGLAVLAFPVLPILSVALVLFGWIRHMVFDVPRLSVQHDVSFAA